jgi:hypothetical protein
LAMWGTGTATQVKPAKTSRELNNAIADDLRKAVRALLRLRCDPVAGVRGATVLLTLRGLRSTHVHGW